MPDFDTYRKTAKAALWALDWPMASIYQAFVDYDIGAAYLARESARDFANRVDSDCR